MTKRGAKWSVVVDLAADPGTGERRRRWHSGHATRREAERARTDILRRIDTAAYIEPSKATVGEYLLREWLPAVRGQVRPGTYDAYQLHIRRYVVPHLGAIPLQKLTRGRVKALYALLGDEGRVRGTGGLSPKTVHNIISCGRRWRTPPTTCSPVTLSTARTAADGLTEMRMWNAHQLRAFLEPVAGDRRAGLWRVAATTGLRRGELLGLRWSMSTWALVGSPSSPARPRRRRAGLREPEERQGPALDTYSHATPRLQEDAATRLAALVEGTT